MACRLFRTEPIADQMLAPLRTVVGGRAKVVHYSQLARLGRGYRAVALLPGPLGPEHAPSLRRNPPALLLASREGTGPVESGLRVLQVLLSGTPLARILGSSFEERKVQSLHELSAAADLAAELAAAAGADRRTRIQAADVVHELGANAILDAPVDRDGTPRYAHQRGEITEVRPEDAARIAMGVEGHRMWVLVEDSFGRLEPAPLADALERMHQRVGLDVSGGGAGLGLRRVLEASELMAVRVVPGRATAVLCAVDLARGRSRYSAPAALFYCRDRG